MQMLMKRLLVFTTLLTALSLTACVPSLHPLYTEADLSFDPALLGVWQEDDGAESWTFKRQSDNEYTLRHVDSQGRVGEFSVRLVNLAGNRFLDLLPLPAQRSENEFYQGHFQPLHTFVWLQQTAPELRLAYLELDWLDKQLKADPAALSHVRLEGELILTAATRELQTYLLKQLSQPNSFAAPAVFKRVETQP